MRLTLPNLLTLSRMFLAPVVFYAVQKGQDWVVLALLAFTALTDIADGWAARATGQVTPAGVVLDPVADKLVVAATLLGGALSGRIPALLAWAYIAKELVQLAGGAWLLARRAGTPIHANRLGKSATVSTYLGFFLVWLGVATGWLLVAAGLGLGLWAAVTYLRTGLAGKLPEGA